MLLIWLLGFLLLLSAPTSADPGFNEKYERDYNIFNPASRYAPDNPLNPANRYKPDTPFQSLGQVATLTP